MAFDRSSAALLVEMSMMQWVGPDRLTLAPAGKEHYDRIVTLYRQRVSDLVRRWEPERNAEARAMLDRLTEAILSEPKDFDRS